MFPVLFEIPLGSELRFPIRMFGLLVILGFLAGTWLVSRRLKQRRVMEPQESFDFCFYLLALGILGARLLYVAQEWDEFEGQGLRIFKIWQGGLVWYGGFALATAFAAVKLASAKKPVLEVGDALALGLALALAVGRWGCFCAGDDYGLVIEVAEGASAPWYAVQFPNPDTAEMWRYRYSETPPEFRAPAWLHPVQIYMSLANLAVLGALLAVSRWARRPGVLAACYFLFYPVARAIVETWRGDEDRGVDVMGSGLSFSQFFSIPVFLVGLLLLKYALSRRPGAEVRA